MKPCEVIASYSEAGQVVPLRIKVYDGDESNVFTIKSYIELPQTYGQKHIRKYRCKIVMNDVMQECDLIFNIEEMKWVLTGIK